MIIFWLLALLFIRNNVAQQSFRIDRYSEPSPGENVMMCYFTTWGNFTKKLKILAMSQEGSSPLCTHVMFAFVETVIKNDNIVIVQSEAALEKVEAFSDAIKAAKIKNPQLKSILGFGGSAEGSRVFSLMVANRARAEIFIDSLTTFLKDYELDGVNLDWHYPTIGEGSSKHDRINYPKFLGELHRRLTIADHRYLLTITLPRHSVQELDKTTLLAMYDMKALNKIVDFYNLLTYDYDQDSNITNVLKGSNPVTFHHTPLYSDARSSLTITSSLCVDTTVKKYIEAGADKSKLVLGLPLYGRLYTLASDKTKIGSPAKNQTGKWPPHLIYSDICEKINSSNWYKKQGTDNAGPYAFKGDQWVSFDDVKMVQNKVEYVSKFGLAGIGFWEITQDDFADNCNQGPFPIMRAAKDALDHIVQGCGEVLTESRGVIQSPNFPANYSNQMFCHWTIKAPLGMSIRLMFQEFNIIGGGSGCSSGDKLNIEEKSFCGNSPPKTVSSARNFMDIFFTTDVHETGKGFLANYTFVTDRGLIWGEWSSCNKPCGRGIQTRNNTSSFIRLGETEIKEEKNCTIHKTCCGGIFNDAARGVISSPNFPDFYDDERRCEWTLEAPPGMFVKLRIEEFDLEFGTENCNNDNLTITGSRGKDKTYCGTMNSTDIYSENNKMVITFQTDLQISKKGFKSIYEYVSDVDCTWSDYGDWSKCSVDCGKGTKNKIRNKTMSSGNGNDCKGLPEETEECVMDCCGETLKAEGILQSKNFPQNYENDLTCQWTIEAEHGKFIKLKFETFELEERYGEECEYDKMDIVGSRGWDNTYCGNTSTSDGLVYSQSNQLKITFTTDSTHTRKGFSARFTFVENIDCVWGDFGNWSQCSSECGIGNKSRERIKYPAIGSGKDCNGKKIESEECNLGECCGGELKNESGNITSPNYGGDYENDKKCSWNFVVPPGMSIKLDFIDFDVAGYDGSCGDDRLVIHGSRTHDKAFCGHGNGTIFSDQNLTLDFITNGYRTRTGFFAEYTFFDCSTFEIFTTIIQHVIIVTAAIGIILNVIVVFIFSSPDMDNVINRLFTAIAIFDIIYLITEILLNSSHETDTSHITLFNILYPLWHVTTTTTMFINIAAAVERYIAVYHPFKTLQSNEDVHSRRKAFLIYFIPVVVFAILFAIPAITEHNLVIQNGHIQALPNWSSDSDRHKIFYYWSLVQICLTITYIVAVGILHFSLIAKQKSQSFLGKQPNWKENSRLTIILLSLAFLDFISVIPRLILFLSIQTKIPDSVDLVASLPNLVMKLITPLAIHAQCGIINGFPVLYWNEIACILRVISCSMNFVILCIFGGKFRMSLCNSISKIKKKVPVVSKYEVSSNSGQNTSSAISELTNTSEASINIAIAMGKMKEDIKVIGERVSKLEDQMEVGSRKDISEDVHQSILVTTDANQKETDTSVSI